MILYLLLSMLAHADAPPSLCYGPECQGKIAEFADTFAHAGPFADQIFLGSGECYHLSADYNSATTHYGFTLIDRQGDDLFFDGSFAFFFPENPYGSLTLETARARTPHRFEANHRLELRGDHAFVDLYPEGPVHMQYWFRQSGGTVYVQGAWGTGHALFCRFDPQ